MKIEISGMYRADCLDLPGTPPVGVGSTKEAAVANLFTTVFVNPESKWIGYVKDFVNIEFIYKDKL